MMKDFAFNVPQDIIFGKGSLKRLPELLEKSGSRKMLLISGPVLKKIGMVEKVEEIVKASGIEIEVFTDVEVGDRHFVSREFIGMRRVVIGGI